MTSLENQGLFKTGRTLNNTWKVLYTAFMHSLLIFCIRNLTRSDALTTRAYIPYACTFHEVFLYI